MLYKIINEIANVPDKETLIHAYTRTRSKHQHTFHIMTNNTNEYKYSFFPRTLYQWFEGPQLSTLVALATSAFIL